MDFRGIQMHLPEATIGYKAVEATVGHKAAEEMVIYKAATVTATATLGYNVMIFRKPDPSIGYKEDVFMEIVMAKVEDKTMAKMTANLSADGLNNVKFLSKDQIQEISESPMPPAMPRFTPQQLLDAIKEDEPELAGEVRSIEADMKELMEFQHAERLFIRERFGRGQPIPEGGMLVIRDDGK